MLKIKNSMKFLPLIMLIMIVLSGCSSQNNSKSEKNTTASQQIETISQISGKNLNGEKVDSSLVNKNKYTLLNVWSTGCSACIEELQTLQKLQENYQEKSFGVIGILADGEYGQTGAYRILQDANVTYDQVIPDKKFDEDFVSKQTAVPYSVLVDEKGNIKERVLGAQTYEYFSKMIEKYINK